MPVFYLFIPLLHYSLSKLNNFILPGELLWLKMAYNTRSLSDSIHNHKPLPKRITSSVHLLLLLLFVLLFQKLHTSQTH